MRYLITVNSETPEKAHGLLGTLLESAIDNPDFIVEAEQPSPEFWLALGVPPQPCLRVRVRAVKEIPLRPAKLVRKIRFETSVAQSLRGTIVGPDDIPLAGAWVELPSLNQSCKTDHKGRFSFAATPVGAGPKLMVIRAKGREVNVDLDKIRTGPAPVTVRIEMED